MNLSADRLDESIKHSVLEEELVVSEEFLNQAFQDEEIRGLNDSWDEQVLITSGCIILNSASKVLFSLEHKQ